MSNEAFAWAKKVVGISSSEKAVLLAIADMYTPTKQAFPGKKTLEQRTCLSRRTISRVTKSLDDKGLIWVQHRQNNYSDYYLSNRYYLPLFDPVAAEAGKRNGRVEIVHPVWDYTSETVSFESTDEE